MGGLTPTIKRVRRTLMSKPLTSKMLNADTRHAFWVEVIIRTNEEGALRYILNLNGTDSLESSEFYNPLALLAELFALSVAGRDRNGVYNLHRGEDIDDIDRVIAEFLKELCGIAIGRMFYQEIDIHNN